MCLLDDYVGLKLKERMMDDAKERILEDVIDSSYRKVGIVASIFDSVHKQTDKEKETVNEYIYILCINLNQYV